MACLYGANTKIHTYHIRYTTQIQLSILFIIFDLGTSTLVRLHVYAVLGQTSISPLSYRLSPSTNALSLYWKN